MCLQAPPFWFVFFWSVWSTTYCRVDEKLEKPFSSVRLKIMIETVVMNYITALQMPLGFGCIQVSAVRIWM